MEFQRSRQLNLRGILHSQSSLAALTRAFQELAAERQVDYIEILKAPNPAAFTASCVPGTSPHWRLGEPGDHGLAEPKTESGAVRRLSSLSLEGLRTHHNPSSPCCR
eukprot:scaffold1224_cov191-Pinguiococcus_pyrenoidosus.AAC.6